MYNYHSQTTLTAILVLILVVFASGCSKSYIGRENASKVNRTPDSSEHASQNNASEQNALNKPTQGNQNTPQSLPQIEKAKKVIHLSSMPDSLTICTVSGTPVTIGDYRRQLTLQDTQLQDSLGTNPNLANQLIALAKTRGITLTEDEKKKLIDTSANTQKVTGEVFKKYLKERKMTEADFNRQVLNLGLAFKMGNKLIEDRLLNEMVDRELICTAARAKGLGKTAFNKYIEIKRSSHFDTLLKSTPLSSDQLKEQIVKDELVSLMVSKIQKQAPVSDNDIVKLYKDNKDKFRHGERIRLSQIIIAAPSVDIPPTESVRTQLKKANPRMTDKDLDQLVKVEEQQIRQRANDLLNRALRGEDFSRLANEFSDDPASRAAKNGGDMGWQERNNLVKEIAVSVWPLKVGEVYKDVITSPYGYHIVKVTGKEGSGLLPFAEVKESLKGVLAQNNSQQAISDWLQEKYRNAPILLSSEFEALIAGEAKGKKTSQVR